MKTADAIAHYGSKAALARALGISKQSVSAWGEDVPLLRAYQLQEKIRNEKEGNE